MDEEDFHGAKYYKELEKIDVSNLYIESIVTCFENVQSEIIRQLQELPNSPITWEGMKSVQRIQQDFGIDNIHFIKPGVGETTRVLLRRIPWKILVNPQYIHELEHILLLAREKKCIDRTIFGYVLCMLRLNKRIVEENKMILFTSDLDRTLIYSKRMMEMFPPNTETMVVERKADKDMSMMTNATAALLQQVHQQTLFVPVTTRALHEYQRIHFINDLCPTFAITSNGGTILEKGQPYDKWTKTLCRRIEESSIPREDMLKLFQTIKSDTWLQRSFYIDDLFFMYIM